MRALFRKPLEKYKGRIVGCAPGTHAAIVSMISRHVASRGPALDIGAHSGALLVRLQELGFANLTGADLDPTRFDLPGAEFHRVELNKPFSHCFTKKFHLITATDVIEHLDNPRAFLKEVHSLLEEQGWLALSLPNVASWQGRIKFLLRGELWGFGEKNYRAQRHISPITFEQMQMMMGELGFKLVESSSAGSFSSAIAKVLTFPLWGLSTLLGGISTLGECAVFLARKATPDAELSLPTHYRSRWKGIPDRIGLEQD